MCDRDGPTHALARRTLGAERKRAEDTRAFFIQLIETALQVFWAFDDGVRPLPRMQARRINRYLLWYWQLARLERVKSGPGVFAILAERPVLELAGLPLIATGERVYQVLAPERATQLELGILHEHALHRLADGPGMPIRDLLEGFQLRDGARILRTLRAALDHLGS